jgi:hypothetical protein
MMIGAIPVEWAMFFTAVVGLGALFFLVRAIVFKTADHFLGKDE